MSSEPTIDRSFLEARAEFDEIETNLGELAAYLSDVADALSHDPEKLDHSLSTSWPQFHSLLEMRETWVARRDKLMIAWRQLEPSRRALHSLPPFASFDRSRAVV